MFFQKGTFAYWSWFDGMVPRNLHMCGYLRQSEINGCDPVLTMPCGRNVSLWVGGLDVKANFVPKIDIVGLIRIALLGGREPLFLKII